jgi:RNA polymerase sigma-70 factor (ECF subfamily)
MPLSLAAVRAPEDLALAARCVGGDRASQRELVQRTKHRVHATLYRVLGNNVQIEDLMQETYLAAFRSLGTYRGEASLLTWIDRCAVHIAYAWLERRRPTAVVLDLVPELPGRDVGGERATLAREAARHLYAALDRIEPLHRLAFTLHVIDGRPLEDVADAMDASLAATKARVWRARQELQKRARKDSVLAAFLPARDADDADEEMAK